MHNEFTSDQSGKQAYVSDQELFAIPLIIPIPFSRLVLIRINTLLSDKYF
jgi:hypothetical protein